MIIEDGKRDFKVNVNLIVYANCYFRWKAVVPIAKKTIIHLTHRHNASLKMPCSLAILNVFHL